MDVVRGVGCERVLQDVLAEGLHDHGVDVRVRVRLSSSVFPDVEIDLLCGEWGVEVKLEPRCCLEGFAQVFAYREFYSLRPVLLQVYGRVDERVKWCYENS